MAPTQGDAKNWAGQVAERRNEQTLRALFSEELGAVIQVRADEKSLVMDVLREQPGRLQPHHRQAERPWRDRIHARRQDHLQPSAQPNCTACGAKPAGASRACATTRPAPTPNTTACWTKPIRASRRRSPST
jgi:hypothetical protein